MFSTTGSLARGLGLVLFGAVACADSVNTAPPALPPRWACPEGWVREANGGCGPALLLCAPGGGAAAGACADVDLVGGRGGGNRALPFRRRPDGTFGGAWPEDGDPMGPPAGDWTPETGASTGPDGWISQGDGTCDPVLRRDCPAGSRALPGGACVAVDVCPMGPWPDAPADAKYVRAGEDDARADGTRERPFGTLARAVDAAGRGGVVALTDGTYPAGLRVTRSVTILGRCPARTTLTGDDPSGSVLDARGSGVELTVDGVTLRGAGEGLSAEGRAHATVRRVVVSGVRNLGVACSDASTRVALTDVVLANVTAGASGASGGLSAQTGCVVEGSRVALDGAGAFPVSVNGGGALTLRDSVVDGGAARPPQFGLAVQDDGALTLERSVVRGIRGVGGRTYGTNVRAMRMTLRDVVIRDGALAGGIGAALVIASGGVLEAERLLITDHAASASGAILVDGAGSSATLRASVARRLTAASEAQRTSAILLGNSAHAALEGFRAEEIIGDGVIATGGSSLEATGLHVRALHRAAGEPEAAGARGLVAWEGATVRLDGCRIEDTEGNSVVAGPGARDVSLERCVLRDVHGARFDAVFAWSGGRVAMTRVRIAGAAQAISASEDHAEVDFSDGVIQAAGTGWQIVWAGDTSVARLSRASVTAHEGGAGVFVAPGGRAELTDVLLRSSAPDESQLIPGGVFVAGEVALERVLIHRMGLGLAVAAERARVTATDLIVSASRQTTELTDPMGERVGPGGGYAVVHQAGELTGTRVAIDSAFSFGLQCGRSPADTESPSARPVARFDGLFVRAVAPGGQGVGAARGLGRSQPAGLLVTRQGRVEAAHATLLGADWGAYVCDGSASLRDGVVASNRLAAGAANQGALEPVRVATVGNGRDEFLREVEVCDSISVPTVDLNGAMPTPPREPPPGSP